MKARNKAAGLLALAALSLAALPAAAADDTTVITVSVTGGSLSIDAPASAVADAAVSGLGTASVPIAATTVTDQRAAVLGLGLQGWTVTATSTDLVHDADADVTIPKANMLWITGAITAPTGSPLTGVAIGAGGTFATTVPVATALVGSGRGSYAYPATVEVIIPNDAPEGDYKATITQTVL